MQINLSSYHTAHSRFSSRHLLRWAPFLGFILWTAAARRRFYGRNLTCPIAPHLPSAGCPRHGVCACVLSRLPLFLSFPPQPHPRITNPLSSRPKARAVCEPQWRDRGTISPSRTIQRLNSSSPALLYSYTSSLLCALCVLCELCVNLFLPPDLCSLLSSHPTKLLHCEL